MIIVIDSCYFLKLLRSTSVGDGDTAWDSFEIYECACHNVGCCFVVVLNAARAH